MEEHYLLISFALILVSFCASLFGSMVGFGGGIFMVPLLVMVFHFPFASAVGSIMLSLIPATIIATYLHRKENNVDFRMGLLMEAPTVAGVVLGSMLVSFISVKRLEILFAVMVFGLGASFFIKTKAAEKKGEGFFYRFNKLKPGIIIKNARHKAAYRISLWVVLLFGMLAGTLAGLFGIGGGFIKTPIMLKVFKMPAKIATATALFMIMITSITGTFSHYLQGHFYMAQAWPIALGFTGGAVAGQQLNVKAKGKTIENLIGLALILAALAMVVNCVFVA